MAREKTFDHKCFDLGEFFLEDEPGLNTEANRRALAIEIQEAIEGFILTARGNYEPSDPMANVEFPFAENH
jgi:hypothetical protein